MVLLCGGVPRPSPHWQKKFLVYLFILWVLGRFGTRLSALIASYQSTRTMPCYCHSHTLSPPLLPPPPSVTVSTSPREKRTRKMNRPRGQVGTQASSPHSLSMWGAAVVSYCAQYRVHTVCPMGGHLPLPLLLLPSSFPSSPPPSPPPSPPLLLFHLPLSFPSSLSSPPLIFSAAEINSEEKEELLKQVYI